MEVLKKHEYEINATTPQQYLNKPDQFSKNLKCYKSYLVDGETLGTKRYVKNGRYLDIALDARIVYFSAN